MRPQSIVLFERIMLGTFAVGLFKTWLDWDLAMARARALGNPNPVPFAIVIVVVTFVVVVGLTLFISRRRSRIAMWLSIAMFALGVPATIALFVSGLPMGAGWITVLQAIGQVAAYGMLFTPTARRWMRKEPDISPDIFR